MNAIALNGRPVLIGTQLAIQDEERARASGNIEYVTVNKVSSARGVEFSSPTGQRGHIDVKQLPTVFKHYDGKKPGEDFLSPNDYVIGSIFDVMMVPDDRLDACLDELKNAVRTMRTTAIAGIAQIEETTGCKFTQADVHTYFRNYLKNIVWQDNGDNTARVNIGDAGSFTSTVKTAKSASNEEAEYIAYVDGQPKGTVVGNDYTAVLCAARARFGQSATVINKKFDPKIGEHEYGVYNGDKFLGHLNADDDTGANIKAAEIYGVGVVTRWRKHVG